MHKYLKIPKLSFKNVENFWKKINKETKFVENCWLWTSCKNKRGYGTFNIKGRPYYAHRISYFLEYKEPGGFLVCHKCDNPSCVNPAHLFLGTQKDNMGDMIKKGRLRVAHGDKHPKSKLTEKQIIEIRKKYATKDYTQEQIGKEYGVIKSTINAIIGRRTWKHI